MLVCVCVHGRVCLCVYPMSRADGLVGGPWAGAEVELLDGDTLVVEADVVCAASRPVLNVTQVCVPVDQHVSPTEKSRHSTSSFVLKHRTLVSGGAFLSQRTLTCSRGKHCVGRLRRRSSLPAAPPVAGQARCWSTADTHNEHP